MANFVFLASVRELFFESVTGQEFTGRRENWASLFTHAPTGFLPTDSKSSINFLHFDM